MHIRFAALLFAAAFAQSGSATARDAAPPAKPTIILVHGAFAESASWDPVIAQLSRDGYRVIAAANPLRGVASDAASVATIVRSVEGPVVLVGHSYGGPVITEAANGNANVKALVYVAGFAPDTGESSLTLSAKFPGSTLGESLAPVALPDGDEDLYIRPEKFHAQFAADLPEAQAAQMAATQRPVTLSALGEPSKTATWKTLPSYMIYGSADRNIPAEAMRFMAERAGAHTSEVRSSHVSHVSHPNNTIRIILEAAESVS